MRRTSHRAPDGTLIRAALTRSLATQEAMIVTAAEAAMQAPWFVDPLDVTGKASNKNDGETEETPLLEGAEIIRRWGTRFPVMGVQPTFTWLSDGPPSDDFSVDIGFASSAGAEPEATINGTLVQVGTATIETFTPRDRGSSTAPGPGNGTPNRIKALGQAGAFWAPFAAMQAIVHDVTANAWFCVDSDAGGGVAVISEPVVSALNFAVFPPTYVTIADGDALVIYRQTTLYSGRMTSPNAETILIQHVSFRAPTGACLGPNTILSPLTFVECSLSSIALAGSAFMVNCSVASNAEVDGGLTVINGTWQNTATSHHAFGLTIFDGDALMNPRIIQEPGAIFYWGRVYFGSLALEEHQMNATPIYLSPANTFYGDAVAWGPGSLSIPRGSALYLDPTETAADVLLIPLTTIDEATEAYVWKPGNANPFGALSPITAAAIDAAKVTVGGATTGGLVGINGQSRILFG